MAGMNIASTSVVQTPFRRQRRISRAGQNLPDPLSDIGEHLLNSEAMGPGTIP